MIDHTDSQYQFGILQGISDYAKHRDVNLLCFEGGIIRNKRYYDYERNFIYDLATEKRLDGIIVLSDSIGHLLEDTTLLRLAESYRPLPVLFVGRGHPEVPSVVIDSSKGMRELVRHLVESHGYRTFAFIKGLAGSFHAKVRYRTLVDTLREFDIPLDDDLVFEGDYLEPSGRQAMTEMLDTVGKTPDVVVACNDEMAIGALNELTRRGIRIPRDVAVVGFDDIIKCGTTDPPLTTVHQPLIREGWTAMKTIVDMLEGKAPPMRTELKSALVMRESCGCSFAPEYIRPRSAVRENGANGNGADTSPTERRIRSILQSISYDYLGLSEQELTDALITSYTDAIAGDDTGVFLTEWRCFIDTARHLEKDDILIKEILVALHGLPLDIVDGEPKRETLFHISLSILKEKATLQIQRLYDRTLKENAILNLLRDELDIRLSSDQIVDILFNNLKTLGIRSAYMAMFERDNGSDRFSRLALAFTNEARHDLSENDRAFPARDLIPDALFHQPHRFSYIVESLSSANQQIGFIILDMTHYIHTTYGVLRRIISSIYHGTQMMKKIEHQKGELMSTIAKLRTTMGGTIKTLSRTVATRDPYTAGHQRRVSDLSRAIAQKMNLPADMTEGIRVAAIVHDLGKLFTPSEILNKPGKLMSVEFELIKHHSEAGCNILKNIDFPWPIANIVMQHHERCDGSGYPLGLKEGEILLQSRIICVADVVEAISSRRPYRAALGLDVALDEIKAFRGVKYDADVVDACLSLFSDDHYEMPLMDSASLRPLAPHEN